MASLTPLRRRLVGDRVQRFLPQPDQLVAFSFADHQHLIVVAAYHRRMLT